jgi:hypothetical protein
MDTGARQGKQIQVEVEVEVENIALHHTTLDYTILSSIYTMY